VNDSAAFDPSVFDHPHDPTAVWARDHVHGYVASGGQDPKHGHEWRGVPTLLLTTVGRRSGEARRTPLIYGRDGDRYVIVASKGGSDAPPGWYVNLTAQPHVRIQVWGDVIDGIAQTAGEDEKPRLWSIMAGIWPAYDEYQNKTKRTIPVVVITPTT
jgi:deazaflavin-dependent oxidoreductase (nitroreductase family)